MSDAFAYDHGYEGAYAHADTRRALAEARGENIACVCLDVGASTDAPAREQVFGGSCFLALPEVRGDEQALRRLFERALAEVTRQARATKPTPSAVARAAITVAAPQNPKPMNSHLRVACRSIAPWDVTRR